MHDVASTECGTAPAAVKSQAKLFIDSSVLFAAARSQTGFARDLLVAGVLGQVTLVISPFVVDETRRNFSQNSPQALPFYETFLSRGIMHSVEPPAALVWNVAAVIAPKDAEIVAGAVHAGAKFLVSYDRRDLLSKRREILDAFGVTVATPDEIFKILKSEGSA
jgi:predicted nucleic acid-binding protein